MHMYIPKVQGDNCRKQSLPPPLSLSSCVFSGGNHSYQVVVYSSHIVHALTGPNTLISIDTGLLALQMVVFYILCSVFPFHLTIYLTYFKLYILYTVPSQCISELSYYCNGGMLFHL